MVEWEQLSFIFSKDQIRSSDLTYIPPTDSNLQTGQVLRTLQVFTSSVTDLSNLRASALTKLFLQTSKQFPSSTAMRRIT